MFRWFLILHVKYVRINKEVLKKIGPTIAEIKENIIIMIKEACHNEYINQ